MALEALLDLRADFGATRPERFATCCELLEEGSRRRLEAVIEGAAQPPLWLIEECAQALEVDAEYFAEWRINNAKRLYDVDVVGVDAALANFDEWAKGRSSR